MSQIITGARGVVRINGTIAGFVGGVNVTVENTLTDVDVIGQLDSADLAETGHKCSFTINTFKAVSADGSSTNAAATIGIDTSSPAGGVAPMRNQAYFDVTLEDDQSKKVFFTLQKSKWEGGSGQMDARGVWQGTWNFKALRGFGL